MTSHHRPEQFRTLRIVQGQQTAAERIHQTVTGSLESFPAFDSPIADVVSDFLQ